MIDLSTIDRDVSGTGPLVRRGLAVAVVLALVGALLLATGRGAFRGTVDVTARVDDAGGSLVPGSDVKVDGVVVGRVLAVEDGGDDVAVRVRLEPDDAREVPAGVTARVLPATVFGTTFVDLVPPAAGAGGGVLQAGATVPQADDAETIELQDALDSSYRILTAVEPAELSTTLGALAEALDGRGEDVGRTVVRLGAYLERLEPEVPLLREDLDLLARNLTTLAEVSPRLLDATEDALVTSRTIVERRAQITALLAGGDALVGEARALVDDVGDPFVEALDGAATVVDAMHDERRGLPDSFLSFVRFAAEQATTFDDGSFMSTDVHIEVGDDAPYTAADCPRYGSASGPRCGGGGAAAPGAGGTPDVDPALVAELEALLSSLDDADASGDGVGALLARPYLGSAP